ncbi:MAG: cytochrome c oxidase subunit 3 family protein, partial [Acidobacteriota bacterium]|nr:cytochrome c oxidase subunit 3 family protein [Acidobacteriota bacterium]
MADARPLPPGDGNGPARGPGAGGPPTGPAYLQHHFDSLVQQKDASSLGMWLFLVTEILFFGGLFLAYTIYRWSYPLAFA